METAAGADVGATLAKLAVRDARGVTRFELLPADALGDVVRQIEHSRAVRVGLTGGGGGELARRLSRQSLRVDEFAAWGAGASALLERQGLLLRERHLLVSLGTGTSVMLVDGMAVTRVGGTALGGGTLMGLCSLLVGTESFAELTGLAAKGSRRRVDLLVSDIYRAGEIALAGDLTAASFGKLERLLRHGQRPCAEDLAHALVGMVGENVALICSGLAAATQVRTIVFAGSTLRDNPALVEILRSIASALGREPLFLPEGEFAGALGALKLAATSA